MKASWIPKRDFSSNEITEFNTLVFYFLEVNVFFTMLLKTQYVQIGLGFKCHI